MAGFMEYRFFIIYEKKAIQKTLLFAPPEIMMKTTQFSKAYETKFGHYSHYSHDVVRAPFKIESGSR
jgi:hypothetical protein